MLNKKAHEELPTPSQLEAEIPLSADAKLFIENSRQTIRNILKGTDPRLLLIVGPCSVHDLDSTYEYAERLSTLAKEVQDHFFIIMRTFLEKPRTSLGWKGFLYDPFLDGSYHLAQGLRLARRLFVDLTALSLPLASEILEIQTSAFFSEILSWGCVGARTSTSQPHRQLASSLPFPMGFKNPPDGNVLGAIQGILSASAPHTFPYIGREGRLTCVRSSGNPDCHLVLRGGEKSPNYDKKSLEKAVSISMTQGLNPSLIVDCSHDNCYKRHEHQSEVFRRVLEEIHGGNPHIRGLMLESHLFEGAQPLRHPLRYGVSITDPCLDFESTRLLIEEACENRLTQYALL